jgi:anthranilate synthase component 1
VYTPVGIYLRLRDRFRDTVLLESADNRALENSFSFIGINAIGGIEISAVQYDEYKIPGRNLRSKASKMCRISQKQFGNL